MIADPAFQPARRKRTAASLTAFHVMTTMRPLNPDGTWGQKQRQEYLKALFVWMAEVKEGTFQTADTEPCRPADRLLQPAQCRGMEQ